jgi:hypothetical protein
LKNHEPACGQRGNKNIKKFKFKKTKHCILKEITSNPFYCEFL